ncbi:hypothetical protein JUN65_14805 [Gluconacetobacter azotocaptans]|uniref:hypothetical protein n=1 Tax=Gluconacetobacter azotocaptans TaxID=142834 RepID=UPI00195C333A|nr:hypothetical protein [Gluconacetobacter azotocaptans]MBM9402849.1 hypothetical protein [Gluconacetobacter azotocaptans]
MAGKVTPRWVGSVWATIVLAASVANAAEPGAAQLLPAVSALKGCWQGDGEVMGKPVTITLSAKPIVQDAMFVVDVDSSAKADAHDRYSAHLFFGGGKPSTGNAAEQIVGFWADSFGGTFTATGNGVSHKDGFEMVYRYPEDTYVNRWRLIGGRLTWDIAARDDKGKETRFAGYSLARAECATGPS